MTICHSIVLLKMKTWVKQVDKLVSKKDLESKKD